VSINMKSKCQHQVLTKGKLYGVKIWLEHLLHKSLVPYTRNKCSKMDRENSYLVIGIVVYTNKQILFVNNVGGIFSQFMLANLIPG
jgi:hypothetical protein